MVIFMRCKLFEVSTSCADPAPFSIQDSAKNHSQRLPVSAGSNGIAPIQTYKLMHVIQRF